MTAITRCLLSDLPTYVDSDGKSVSSCHHCVTGSRTLGPSGLKILGIEDNDNPE